MPANPIDDAPLTDPGFNDVGPVRAALEAKPAPRKMHPGLDTPVAPPPPAAPRFDPTSVERPPRPQSSFADAARTRSRPSRRSPRPSPSSEPVVSQSSTSTFVAAARRAQRAKQETQASATTAIRCSARPWRG